MRGFVCWLLCEIVCLCLCGMHVFVCASACGGARLGLRWRVTFISYLEWLMVGFGWGACMFVLGLSAPYAVWLPLRVNAARWGVVITAVISWVRGWAGDSLLVCDQCRLTPTLPPNCALRSRRDSRLHGSGPAQSSDETQIEKVWTLNFILQCKYFSTDSPKNIKISPDLNSESDLSKRLDFGNWL